MQIISYRLPADPQPRASRWTKPTWIIFGVIVAIVIFNFLTRGPSRGTVQSWMAQLPPGASRAQVLALFAEKDIQSGDDRNEKAPAPYRLYGNIYCEGDRALSISVEMSADDHILSFDISEGYRGL